MTTSAVEARPQVVALEMSEVTVPALRDTEKVVLEGVNWSVGVGDYWAVAGLLGSGKSDLLSMAAGLMGPMRGTYRVFGRELETGFEQDLLAARLLVGLVFDGGRLLNHLTLAENVALPLRYHHNLSMSSCADRVESLLEFVGLAARANTTPSAVSRNVQQRVGLARALILQPEVLLLDSPLTGLDPRDAAWWLDTLDQLSAGHRVADGKPITLVATADDLRPWKARARQFAILKNQHLIVLGNRVNLAGHPEPLLHELLPASP